MKANSIALALCAAGLLSAPAIGQQANPDIGDDEVSGSLPGPDTVDEEIVVRGRTRAQLRTEVQLAEEAVYARFNEINSSDEFDIHCRLEVLTGSRMLRRICEPNFWRTAKSDAGRETVVGLQGGYAMAPQQFRAEGLYKHSLLADEMHRLAREDQQFASAVVHLAELTDAYDRVGESRTGTPGSRVVSKDDEALAYDADVRADVRIGRKPWRHRLTRPTFTIANVYGEVESIEIDCDDHRPEKLPYAPGAEWTVPDGWPPCTLRVDATNGTTFSLYEFQ
jgi:hypothetical protein